MFTRILLVGALLVASLAYFFAGAGSDASPEPINWIQGKNKTVLFLANKEHGLSNAHVATAFSLLENYPDIDVHFASFDGMEKKLARISSFAQKKTPEAKPITYHVIKGTPFAEACYFEGRGIETLMHPPRLAGLGVFLQTLTHFVAPWDAESYFEIYQDIGALIDEVDPSVVVTESLLIPAQDVTRDKKRLHAMISPNTAVDTFLPQQGFLQMLYKYPAFSSGFDFPVPLKNIPENILMNFRFIYGVVTLPGVAAKKAALRAMGVKEPIRFFEMYDPSVPWISMDTEGAAIPIDVIPANVTRAGPMVISSAPAAEQDPELAAWLAKAPTVLINLGSHYSLREAQAETLALAIKEVLDKTGAQVLWKYIKREDYADDFLAPLKTYIDNGRLRASNWLTVDPFSILETGNVAAFVHHGGSNCYHEGVLSGVPQVILPMWADLYNFASLVEMKDIGVWGCRENSPEWTVECLSGAFLDLLDGGKHSLELKEKARKLGDEVSAREKGRDISARRIAELAYIK